VLARRETDDDRPERGAAGLTMVKNYQRDVPFTVTGFVFEAPNVVSCTTTEPAEKHVRIYDIVYEDAAEPEDRTRSSIGVYEARDVTVGGRYRFVNADPEECAAETFREPVYRVTFAPA
jgi:hypothetical protein